LNNALRVKALLCTQEGKCIIQKEKNKRTRKGETKNLVGSTLEKRLGRGAGCRVTLFKRMASEVRGGEEKL